MIAEKILGQTKQKMLLQKEASFSYLNMIKSVKKRKYYILSTLRKLILKINTHNQHKLL